MRFLAVSCLCFVPDILIKLYCDILQNNIYFASTDINIKHYDRDYPQYCYFLSILTFFSKNIY